MIKQIAIEDIDYTPVDGEVIQTPEGHYMMYNQGNWEKVTVNGKGIEMSLYDLNKDIVRQLPTLTHKELENKAEIINQFGYKTDNEYYMMYGKEISYFTVLHLGFPHLFGKEVIDCLSYVGEVKSIGLTADKDAVEIWVMKDENEATCLYLFPYDIGVIEVGECYE